MYVGKSLSNYLNNLAAKKPIPGGGSASALVASVGVALSSMVARFTIGNRHCLKQHHHVKKLLQKNERIRKRLILLIDKDAQAYLNLSRVLTLSRKNRRRNKLLQLYLKQAASVPFEICVLAHKALQICFVIGKIGNINLITDTGCSGLLLEGAFHCAALNVRINLKYINDKAFVKNKERVIRKMAYAVKKLNGKIITETEGVL